MLQNWRDSSFYLYLSCLSFIVGWWLFAFSAHPFAEVQEKPSLLSPEHSFFSPIKRDSLQQALAGNTDLMVTFIQQWNEEADALNAKGIAGIQRLSPSQYTQFTLLAYLLHHSPTEPLTPFHTSSIEDDCGRRMTIQSDPSSRFLPQTFVAASILLALVNPDRIIAIPQGLRQLSHLYPPLLLDQIKQDVEHLNSETIFREKPDLAFISHYSNPATISRFEKQQIPLCTFSQIDTIADIQQVIIKIGHLAQRPLQAQLLSLFIEAALMAIDNRLHALQDLTPSSPFRCLTVHHQHHDMIPTTRSLTGQLLERAKSHHANLICLVKQDIHGWRVPFSREEIALFNPDCLIISLPYPMQQLELSSAFKQSNAIKHKRLFYVDETVQESPTQYIVLAYFDLFKAIEAYYL